MADDKDHDVVVEGNDDEEVEDEDLKVSYSRSHAPGGGSAGGIEDRLRASIEISRQGQFADARKQGEFRNSLQEEDDARRSSLEQQMEGSPDPLLESFPLSTGLSSEEAKKILDQVGPNKLPEKVTPKWLVFVRLLMGPLPYMLWIAAIIEAAIQEWIDFGILFGILLGNACLGYHETMKAGDAVAALKKSLKPACCVFRDGKWVKDFDATLLVPGDLVELGLGSTVPADCLLNEGTIDCDESAMTGESFPVTLREREMAKMGGLVVRGETHATVVLTGANTFFGKTASMLNQGGRGYSNMQILLMRIVMVLVVSTLTLSFTCFGYLLGIGISITDSLDFFVAVVVSSIPLAIEIVATVTLALGSREMSSYGAIVNRLAAIEDLAGMNMLCSDKTGTLTKNKMVIQSDAPAFLPDTNQMDLLRYSALAAKWESPPKDALDTLVLRCHLWWSGYQDAKEKWKAENPDAAQADLDNYLDNEVNGYLQKALEGYQQLDYIPFDARVKRTESTIRKPTGEIFKITKGAPHIVGALDANQNLAQECEELVVQFGEDGVRCMAIAISEPLASFDPANEASKNAPVTWHLAGLLTFCDPPRDDTKDTIARATQYGVPVRMITGDHVLIAKKTCRDLDMGDMSNPAWPNIQGPEGLPRLDENGKPPHDLVENYGPPIEAADGFAQVFPEHKFLIVETFRRMGYKCGMTGDGVNDAPALKCADVGIAVAGATDAATAAADIILTREGLATIIDGLITARVVFQRVKNFLTYRIAASYFLLIFSFVAVFALIPSEYRLPQPLGPIIMGEEEYTYWRTFYQLPVLYLMLITILNDGTLISIGYDTLKPSRYPEAWNLPLLFFVSTFLASFPCVSSLVLLWMMMDSWNPDGAFQALGINEIGYGTLNCGMYLQLAVSAILTLFSCRTQEYFFFKAAPHPVLALCCILAVVVSLMISLFWKCSELNGFRVCGLAWEGPDLLPLWILLYAFVTFLVQDVFKVLMFMVMRRFNLLGINDSTKPKQEGGNGE